MIAILYSKIIFLPISCINHNVFYAYCKTLFEYIEILAPSSRVRGAGVLSSCRAMTVYDDCQALLDIEILDNEVDKSQTAKLNMMFALVDLYLADKQDA